MNNLTTELLYIPPIIAYRFWSIYYDPNKNFFLGSISVDMIWPVKERLEAKHLSPMPHMTKMCQCGIYSLKLNKEDIHWYFGTCFGSVFIWGDIAEYQSGYISQYAYPLKITAIRCEICGVKLYGFPGEKAQALYLKNSSYYRIGFYCTEHSKPRMFTRWMVPHTDIGKKTEEVSVPFDEMPFTIKEVLDSLSVEYGITVSL